MLLFIDLETTGLPEAQGTKLEFQPYIVELCAIKTNTSFKVIKEINTLIQVPIPMKKEVIKVHNITDQMLKNKPVFASVYKKLSEVALGCHTMIAHNLPFESTLLGFELLRIGKLFNFPWPPIHFCTVEQSLHLNGYKLRLNELYEIATGKKREEKGTHRAKRDVKDLITCYKWLRKEK